MIDFFVKRNIDSDLFRKIQLHILNIWKNENKVGDAWFQDEFRIAFIYSSNPS